MSAPDDVLAVHDLRVTYRTRAGAVQAVKGVSFAIAPGRLLSVVGESGSGKSSLALAVLGALGGEASVTGEARYRGDDLLQMPRERFAASGAGGSPWCSRIPGAR